MNKKVLLKDDGVHLKEINEPTMKVLQVIIEVGNLLDREMVITSANDGVHHGDGSNNSLHFSNLAWDTRTHHLTGQEQLAMEQFLRQQLGNDWDIILEDVGTDNVHEHIEYDPK